MYFRSLNNCHFGIVEVMDLKSMALRSPTFIGMTSLLNFMKLLSVTSKVIVVRDRQTAW
jgi:hypothetical protein